MNTLDIIFTLVFGMLAAACMVMALAFGAWWYLLLAAMGMAMVWAIRSESDTTKKDAL